MPPRSNAITQRLDIVVSNWQEFATNPRARVCRWVVQPDEVEMIMAFVKVENANEAQTNDLFIRFRSPFENINEYSQSLVQELAEEWDAYQNYLPKKGQPLPWAPSNGNVSKAYPQYFLGNFKTFSEHLPDFGGLAVAFLSPDENTAPVQLAEWCQKALTVGIPERLRLMLIDVIGNTCYDTLASTYPDEVISLEPKLDMPGAMRQIAATGDPKDPGVQFRKRYVELTQYAQQGKFEQMQQAGEAAISVAFREGWTHLQVGVHIAMAAGYLGKKLTKEALSAYDQARQVARINWEAGDALSGKLLAQAHLGQGSIYFGDKDFAAAGQMYQGAIVPAIAVEDVINTVEACRMTGLCHEMMGNYQDAWDYNKNALNEGEKLDEKLRPQTTLPYVGQALLRLSKRLSLDNEEEAIVRKMKSLCGEDWEDRVLPKKSKS